MVGVFESGVIRGLDREKFRLILILLRELERDLGLEKFNGKISRRSVVRKSLIAKMCS